MKEKLMMDDVEVEGIELLDLGDTATETKQPHPISQITDHAIAWTYFGLQE